MAIVHAISLRPGEAWGSWFDRGAHTLKTGLSTYANLVGLHPNREQVFRQAAWGIDLPEAQIDDLAHRSSATHDDIRGSLFGSLRGICLPDTWKFGSGTPAAGQAWAYPVGTGACAGCVADTDGVTGVHQLTWKTPWHFACLHHQGRLLDRHCPSCGGRIGASRADGSPFPAQPHRRHTPGTCRWSIQRGRDNGPNGWDFCGTDLTTTPPLGHLTPDSDAWTAQEGLLNILDGAPATIRGQHVPAPALFSRLRGLAALTLATFDRHDLDTAAAYATEALTLRLEQRAAAAEDRAGRRDGRRGRRTRTWLATPTDARLLAWVVPIAVHTADGDPDQIDAAARRLRAMGDNQPTKWLNRYRIDDDLAEQIRRAATTRSTGITAPDRPTPILGPDRLPTHYPHNDYERAFSRLLDDLALTDSTRRQLVSLAILRHATGATNIDAANALGIPVNDHGVCVVAANGVHKLTRAGRLDAFNAAVTAETDRLATLDPTIDWNQRRRHAATWRPNVDALRNIYAHAGITVTESRLDHLEAWLWAEHTGHHWTDAPVYGPNGAIETQIEIARRWRTATLPLLDLTRTDSHLTPPAPEVLFGPERLPRLYPLDQYQAIFALLLHPCRTREDTGRQVVTTAVLAAAGHHLEPAGHHAAAVGIPIDTRGRYPAHDWVRDELARRHTITDFDTAITAETERIADQNGGIDWTDRRTRYSAWTPARPESDRIYTAAGIKPTATRHVNLSAWAWEQITGNPWAEAPLWLANTASDNQRTVYQAWRRTLLPKIAAAATSLVNRHTATGAPHLEAS